MNATDTDTSKSQRQLAAGVFNQATRDLQRFHGATTKIEKELYFDAYSWVISDDCYWRFSFLNVCRLLGLAPADIRHELLGDHLPGSEHPSATGNLGGLARICRFKSQVEFVG